MSDQRADFERTIEKAKRFDLLLKRIIDIKDDLKTRATTPLSFNGKIVKRLEGALEGIAICAHRKPKKLPYLEDHDDAERRMAKGETQRKCPVCKLFIWESDYYG